MRAECQEKTLKVQKEGQAGCAAAWSERPGCACLQCFALLGRLLRQGIQVKKLEHQMAQSTSKLNFLNHATCLQSLAAFVFKKTPGSLCYRNHHMHATCQERTGFAFSFGRHVTHAEYQGKCRLPQPDRCCSTRAPAADPGACRNVCLLQSIGLLLGATPCLRAPRNDEIQQMKAPFPGWPKSAPFGCPIGFCGLLQVFKKLQQVFASAATIALFQLRSAFFQ